MTLDHIAQSAVSRALPSLLRTRNKQRLMILIYHRVLSQKDFMMPSEPDISEFDWQMELLARHFDPLPLTEAWERMCAGTLPPRAVCVTFDDGYADNHNNALPVLQAHGIPATVFIATAFLNGGIMWNDVVIESLRRQPLGSLELGELGLGTYAIESDADRKQVADEILSAIKHFSPDKRLATAKAIAADAVSLPGDLMMNDDQVRNLHAAGVQIGGHTRSHPILAAVDLEQARSEIAGGKADLERLTGAPVTAFAYPNGRPDQDFTEAHRDLLPELGFSLAVTTEPLAASPACNRYTLPRFTPWDKTPVRFLVRLLHAYTRQPSL